MAAIIPATTHELVWRLDNTCTHTTRSDTIDILSSNTLQVVMKLRESKSDFDNQRCLFTLPRSIEATAAFYTALRDNKKGQMVFAAISPHLHWVWDCKEATNVLTIAIVNYRGCIIESETVYALSATGRAAALSFILAWLKAIL